MKQKKMLVWGVALAGVMLTAYLFIYLGFGYELPFVDLLLIIVPPMAACGILAAATYEKRGLGIISSAMVLSCETLYLVCFGSYYWHYLNVRVLLELLVSTVYVACALPWLLRFIINRPMEKLLMVIAVVGASVCAVQLCHGLPRMPFRNVIVPYGLGKIVFTLCSILYEAGFWTLLLLAACGRPQTADESAVEFAAETVPSAEEETVPVRAQETTAPASNALDALERLAKLHERGILTDAEFESKKAELLSKI